MAAFNAEATPLLADRVQAIVEGASGSAARGAVERRRRSPSNQIVVDHVEPGEATVKRDYLTGRTAFYMRELIERGERGFSTAELQAGLRVSDGVYKLRRLGFAIDSSREKHDGEFAGNHSVYTLKSRAWIVSASEVGAA